MKPRLFVPERLVRQKTFLAVAGMLLASAAIAAALLAIAAIDVGRDVPFQTLAQGEHGRPARAIRVICTQAELDASGVRQLLAPGTQIDFEHEMLISIESGTKSEGGYWTVVTGVVHRRLPAQPHRSRVVALELPRTGHSSGFELELELEPRGFCLPRAAGWLTPREPGLATKGFTAPFLVVKLARCPVDRVAFIYADGSRDRALSVALRLIWSVVLGAGAVAALLAWRRSALAFVAGLGASEPEGRDDSRRAP